MNRWTIRTYGHFAVVNCVFGIHATVAGSRWGGAFLQTHVGEEGRPPAVGCLSFEPRTGRTASGSHEVITGLTDDIGLERLGAHRGPRYDFGTAPSLHY